MSFSREGHHRIMDSYLLWGPLFKGQVQREDHDASKVGNKEHEHASSSREIPRYALH
jgi:hypothetical protein